MMVCVLNITCKKYAWPNGGSVQDQYCHVSKDVDLFTRIGNRSGRYIGGPSNIQVSVGPTQVSCLGQRLSLTGWGFA